MRKGSYSEELVRIVRETLVKQPSRTSSIPGYRVTPMRKACGTSTIDMWMTDVLATRSHR